MTFPNGNQPPHEVLPHGIGAVHQVASGHDFIERTKQAVVSLLPERNGAVDNGHASNPRGLPAVVAVHIDYLPLGRGERVAYLLIGWTAQGFAHFIPQISPAVTMSTAAISRRWGRKRSSQDGRGRGVITAPTAKP